MNRCVYDSVNVNCDGEQNDSKKWRSLIRQIFICSGLWTMYFTPGLFLGVPPVYIAQSRKISNSTEAVSAEMASWISSVFGYAAIPWVLILPLITQRFGRKVSFYFVTISSIASHSLLYCSTTLTEFFISEIITSITFASHTTLLMQVIAEYTSPRYRGVFLTLKGASMFWGIWIGNIIGTFYHWKYVGLIGLVCSVYCGTALFWPESPYWLASKRRYQECTEAHYWLKGYGTESRKELEMLINNKKNYNENTLRKRTLKFNKGFSELQSVIFTDEFYKPMLLTLTLYLLYYCSGKLVCNMYVLEIVTELTASESAAYLTMLVLDGVTVFGMYIGCLLSRIVKRRTLLFTCASNGVLFLYTVSLYLYLIKLEILEKNNIIIISLLTGFSICITIGPMLLLSTICAEIVPQKYNQLACCMVGLIDKIIFSIVLKLSPSLFRALGIHGSFLFYGVSSNIFVLILYKYLPETKDKTLQEIGNSFKNKWSNQSE
ncbi:facilitated trehalose transporter Tret1-2 homolog [Cydia splendana]|uniref:facilitated trehalose transporter Tret1-2 homolog n=1 Tax=Cydia splendana TaxID=1100963 RepID=UPI002139C3FE